jgi:hypothetical protein
VTPLDDTTAEILAAWERMATTEVEEGRLLANHCVLACKVLLRTFNEHDIPVTVHPTQVIVTNAASRQLIADRIPFDKWPPHAWSIGSDRTPKPGQYPGHLILTTATHLIDPSAGQFNRPGKLHVPNVIVTDLGGFHTEGNTGATGPDGTTVEWFKDPTLGLQHRNSPNWRSTWMSYHRLLSEEMTRANQV